MPACLRHNRNSSKYTISTLDHFSLRDCQDSMMTTICELCLGRCQRLPKERRRRLRVRWSRVPQSIGQSRLARARRNYPLADRSRRLNLARSSGKRWLRECRLLECTADSLVLSLSFVDRDPFRPSEIQYLWVAKILLRTPCRPGRAVSRA